MTDYHPRSYPGTRMWGETTASLAYLGSDCGWLREYYKGVDLLTNHVTGVAVIVTAGDSATGADSYRPQVRYERQDVITHLVNGSLDTLFDAARGRAAEWSVWFLLHNLDRGDRVVPAELSRPEHISDSGYVTTWRERVIIPAVWEGGGGRLDSEVENADPDVAVQRRAV